MTVLLGLRNRIIFKRCLWVSGLPGVHIKYTSSSSEEHRQVGQIEVPSLKQILREKKMCCLQSHNDRVPFIPKETAKGICALWKFKEKYQVHMGTHRWGNNNLRAEISKRTCAYLKGTLCSPRKNSKSEYISALKTAKNFHELFSLPPKCDFFAYAHYSPVFTSSCSPATLRYFFLSKLTTMKLQFSFLLQEDFACLS